MTTWPITRRQAVTVVLALAVVLLLAARWVGSSASSTGRGTVAAPVRVKATPAARPKLLVHVVGAVRRPGLYRVADGARVATALARAGGTTAKADLEMMNLAAPLADGQQVLVPSRRPPGAPAGATTAPAGPVSLSAATLDELDTLPGVGPVTAQKILDYRAAHGAFGSVEELDAVPGIGPARIEALRELVVP